MGDRIEVKPFNDLPYEDGYVVVTFPSGKEIKLLVDPLYETISMKTRE